jgi:hypothetical protein
MTKKTLILKVAYDVSDANEAQIEFMKAFMLAGISQDVQKQCSFEVLVEDEQVSTERMRQAVRQEFREHDQRGRRRGRQG